MKIFSHLSFCFWGVLFFAAITFGQNSPTINVQGVLRDANNHAVQNGTYQLTFNLYNTLTGGSSLWTESHANVKVNNGIYSVQLGTSTPFTNIPFNQQYYLGVSVNGGTELSPRMPLSLSPYSLSVRGVNNVFPSSGNVGIGTTSPNLKLDINGSLGLHNGNISLNGGYLSGDGNNEGVFVNGNGLVGIGTNSPDNGLQVTSRGAYENLSDGVHLGEDNGGNTHIELVKNGGSPYIDFSNTNSEDFAARLMLHGDNDFRIEGTNVGIGTSYAPDNALVAAGANGGWENLNDGVHLGLDPNKSAHIELVSRSDAPYIDFSQDGSDYDARLSLDNRDRVLVTARNGLKIETPHTLTSSDEMFSVYLKSTYAITVKTHPYWTGKYAFSVNGDSWGYHWYTFSDRRLKTNIKNYTTLASLNKINRLKIKTYNFKGGSNKNVGLIAQDVKKIIPDAVITTNSDKTLPDGKVVKNIKTINYDRILLEAIGAMQDMSKEIKQLKKENADLNRRVSRLEKKR